MYRPQRFFTVPMVAALAISINCFAGIGGEVHHLQTRWAEVNYQLAGKTRLTAFQELIETADKVTETYPKSAEAWTWSGIIKSSYAGASGGLTALHYAKAARADLEKAIAIDDNSLSASAYTSLGTLYARVPGWPLGFGDDKQAETLLRKAVALNPDDIDSNYFYGNFLADQHRYREAESYLKKASRAPARPGRPIADAGRHQEINKALALVRKKLAK